MASCLNWSLVESTRPWGESWWCLHRRIWCLNGFSSLYPSFCTLFGTTYNLNWHVCYIQISICFPATKNHIFFIEKICVKRWSPFKKTIKLYCFSINNWKKNQNWPARYTLYIDLFICCLSLLVWKLRIYHLL